MIYELAVVVKPDAAQDQIEAVKQVIESVTKESKGSVLLTDEWGTMKFPQPTSEGLESGQYVYFIFSSATDINPEIQRRLSINESVVKFLAVKIGEAGSEESILKNFKSPFSKSKSGSIVDEGEGEDSEKNKRKFAKRKNCWFTAKNIKADWKDPNTYSWLVNEFGKISPARVSGVSRKHQRFVNTAIKRARQIGVASYMNNRVAERV